MRNHFSIDQLSNATARLARGEAAMLQRDINKLRDSIAGLNHAIKAPKIKTLRGKTKKTTNAPSVFADFANLAAGDVVGALGLSGGASASQNASRNLLTLALGQRIR